MSNFLGGLYVIAAQGMRSAMEMDAFFEELYRGVGDTLDEKLCHVTYMLGVAEMPILKTEEEKDQCLFWLEMAYASNPDKKSHELYGVEITEVDTSSLLPE